jgi:hypothetical protein
MHHMSNYGEAGERGAHVVERDVRDGSMADRRRIDSRQVSSGSMEGYETRFCFPGDGGTYCDGGQR